MEYVTSSFGVNIGTGLMLESILTPTNPRIDDERKIPEKINLKVYKKWWINIHSLIVNIITSYDKDTLDMILKGGKTIDDMVMNKISDELEILVNIIPTELKFFYLGYPKYKNYLNKIDNTTKTGKIYLTALKYVEMLSKLRVENDLLSHNVKYSIAIGLTSNTIHGMDRSNLMTTSNNIDLVHSMPLLEFHTGVLKNRNQFYTKLKTKDPIPFEEIILLSIGDKKNRILSPLTFKEKKILIEAIMKRKMRSYARYNRATILSLITDTTLLGKLKNMPNIY